MLDDEDAGALARLDQAVGRQLGQRLADHGAADAEGLGQLALGRQLLARLDLAGLQLLAERRDHAFRKLGLAFDPEVRFEAMSHPYLKTLGSHSEMAGM